MKPNSLILLRFPKRVLLGIALAFGVLIFGCTKEECDCPTQTTPPPNTSPDEYYVKYEVNSSTIYLGAKMDAIIRKEDSSFTTFSISQGGSWETTIGPVGKGFNTSLDVIATTATQNKLKLNAYISTSKNGSAFALKQSDESDVTRDEVAINYTIDY